MRLYDTLKQLCAAPGVNGQRAASETAAQLLRPLADEVTIDPSGSVIARRFSKRQNAPTVLLEAHIDQVGFVVTGVDEKGFVRVAACGGVDRRALPAAEVTVYGDRPYRGVFCSVPPHLAAESTLPEIEELGLDIGLAPAAAKAAVKPGNRAVFLPTFDALGEHRVCAPALDDRAGCAAILHGLELLKDESLPCHVAAVFAVKEEVGGHGATAAAFGLAPAAALVTDVSFAATPDADAAKCGMLGGGAMLGYSPVLDSTLTERLEQLAAKESIPVQPEVMGGATGTDADRITLTRAGVPTALLSIPLRYMHTPAELVDRRDIKAVGALMAAFVKGGLPV